MDWPHTANGARPPSFSIRLRGERFSLHGKEKAPGRSLGLSLVKRERPAVVASLPRPHVPAALDESWSIVKGSMRHATCPATLP